MWGKARPGATRYGTTGVESGLCTNGGISYGLSYAISSWPAAAEACPSNTWVCTEAERGTGTCDTSRPDSAEDATSWNGVLHNFTASLHRGFVSDVGSTPITGKTLVEDGSSASWNTANHLPVWCCSE